MVAYHFSTYKQRDFIAYQCDSDDLTPQSGLTFAHDLTISNTDCTIRDSARIVMKQGLS